MLRGHAGTIGYYVLCFFLMFYGAVGLIGLALPVWIGFLAAFIAGFMLAIGK